MLRLARNPYVPTDVIPPAYFAGRKEILARASALLENARAGISGGLLLSGHRGIGKTSALRAIEATLGKRIGVVRLRFSKPVTVEAFADELAARVKREQGGWRTKIGVKEVQLPYLTMRVEPRARDGIASHLALYEMLRSLRGISVLWVSLDDFDWVDGHALNMLKSAMEEAGTPPVVLCVAGGPQIREHLILEHSPIVRFFTGSDFDLGNFSFDETREALALPLEKGGLVAAWEDEAAREVHRWTGGYPFLTQCLAHAAFDAGRIGRGHVISALPEALRAAGTWMDGELLRASDRDIVLLDRIGRAHKERWRASELDDLGVAPIYVMRLVRYGALRRVARGRYIVAKPPMIARYHMWKRGLDPGEGP